MPNAACPWNSFSVRSLWKFSRFGSGKKTKPSIDQNLCWFAGLDSNGIIDLIQAR